MSTVEPGSDNLFASFLDDYYAECDEHLSSLRRNLLALESFVNQQTIDRQLLDDIFRRFHSLKGISAMVSVQAAERLAHHMESYLRALRQDQMQLRQNGMDALIEGTKMLERVIAARRAEAPAPDIEPTLTCLEGVLSQLPKKSESANGAGSGEQKIKLKDDERARLEAALQVGCDAWLFHFTPSAALSARGINVNSVRAQLQELGQLVHAAPIIGEKGDIAFEFVIASDRPEADFTKLVADGINYVRFHLPVSAGARVPEPTVAAPSLAPSNIVRVDLSRLDDLMRMVGELVISRAHLDENLRQLEANVPAAHLSELHETNMAMERQLRDLREGMMRVRMVPVREIFERMQFVVRDLARESDKKVVIEMSGQETEIDKFLVEQMMDPLLHLVRNSFSHGLESSSERIAAGKPPEGKIRLRAATVAERVVITIEDDGRGVNAERVAARARSMGLLSDEPIPDNDTLLEIICAPGFSTRDEADRASGRGVGMSVVKETVANLGGSLNLETEKEKGTRFNIELPLTLAIADALIVEAGGQRYAVPQLSVNEIIELDRERIKKILGNEIIPYRDTVLPLARLSRLFRIPEGASRYALVTGNGSSHLGLVVDAVVGQREIVVRAITDRLIDVPGVSGATELGDGRAILIIDVGDLTRAVRQWGSLNALPVRRSERSEDKKRESSAMAERKANEPFILFELAGTTYALRSSAVQQMEMIEHITPVPNAPAFVEGVVFLRGQVIPAVNLRARFGFAKIAHDLRTRLIVVNNGERRVGLIVDTSREFINIDTEAIKSINESITGLSGEYLEGIVRLGERLVLVLKLDQVIDFSNFTIPASQEEKRTGD